MKDVALTMEKLEAISGRLDKESIVASMKDSAEFKFMFETALNPFYNYNVVEFDDGIDYRKDVPTLTELQSMREKLLDKTFTGNAARDILRKTLLTSDQTTRKWLVRMFKKDLKCGVSTTSINKVFNGLIPEFKIGLCDKFEDSSIFKMGKWIAEPKYDGNRGIAFVDRKYNVTVVSRNQKPMWNIEHITKQLSDMCKEAGLNDMIFDGEMYASNWNDSISIIHSQSKVANAKELNYYIFDMVHGDEWAMKSTKKLAERKAEITEKFKNMSKYTNIKITPWDACPSSDEAEDIYKKRLGEGYEGLVLKSTTAGYPFGRCQAWLKWKPVETYDCKITGWEPGTGKYLGILGAFVCDLDGVKVKVGGGYNDSERTKFWNDKEKMKGKTIEVKCQQKTKDGSLRFPVFMRIREDK